MGMADVMGGAEPLENQRARCGPEKLPEPTCVQGSARSGFCPLTFSTANVLITYSASSSVSIRVTLMSL